MPIPNALIVSGEEKLMALESVGRVMLVAHVLNGREGFLEKIEHFGTSMATCGDTVGELRWWLITNLNDAIDVLREGLMASETILAPDPCKTITEEAE